MGNWEVSVAEPDRSKFTPESKHIQNQTIQEAPIRNTCGTSNLSRPWPSKCKLADKDVRWKVIFFEAVMYTIFFWWTLGRGGNQLHLWWIRGHVFGEPRTYSASFTKKIQQIWSGKPLENWDELRVPNPKLLVSPHLSQYHERGPSHRFSPGQPGKGVIMRAGLLLICKSHIKSGLIKMRFNPRKVANKKSMNKNDPELASKILLTDPNFESVYF